MKDHNGFEVIPNWGVDGRIALENAKRLKANEMKIAKAKEEGRYLKWMLRQDHSMYKHCTIPNNWWR